MGKLGQYLVGRGWASSRALKSALAAQAAGGGRLGTYLLDSNVVTEDQLTRALADIHRMPGAGAEDLRGIPDEVIALLPVKLARRLEAVPFRAFGTQVHVALADADNLAAQDEIVFAVGKRVVFYVAPEVRVAEALERYYGEPSSSQVSHLIERLNRARFLWDKPGDTSISPGPTALSGDWDEPSLALFREPPRLPEVPAPLPPPPPRPVAPPPRASEPAPSSPSPPAPPSLERLAPAAPAPSIVPSAPSPTLPSALNPIVPSALNPIVPSAPSPIVPSAPREPKILSLSETERHELLASGPAPEPVEPIPETPSAPPLVVPSIPLDLPPPVRTLEEALAQLEQAEDAESVGAVLIELLGRRFDRVGLFKAFRDQVVGWRGAGAELDATALEGYRQSFDEASIFLNLRTGGPFILGPLARMPSHRRFGALWGSTGDGNWLFLPLRIHGRLVAVVALERNGETPRPEDVEQGLAVASAAALAFERSILRKKKE